MLLRCNIAGITVFDAVVLLSVNVMFSVLSSCYIGISLISFC